MKKFPGPAVLLLACKGPDGRILIPVEPASVDTPGILIPEGRSFAHDASVAAIMRLGGGTPPLGALSLQEDFAEPLRTGVEGSVLVLGHLIDPPAALLELGETLPDICRRMPRDRNRIAYIKAWQILTGSLTLETKAIESKDLQ